MLLYLMPNQQCHTYGVAVAWAGPGSGSFAPHFSQITTPAPHTGRILYLMANQQCHTYACTYFSNEQPHVNTLQWITGYRIKHTSHALPHHSYCKLLLPPETTTHTLIIYITYKCTGVATKFYSMAETLLYDGLTPFIWYWHWMW